MAQEGHTVGNHTYHHWDMSKIGGDGAVPAGARVLETLYRDTTGQELAKFYRPPQGIYSEKNLENGAAARLSHRVLEPCLCGLAAGRSADVGAGHAKLIPRIHNGAVVLLHSTSQTNAAILDSLLTRWEEMGLFVR